MNSERDKGKGNPSASGNSRGNGSSGGGGRPQGRRKRRGGGGGNHAAGSGGRPQEGRDAGRGPSRGGGPQSSTGGRPQGQRQQGSRPQNGQRHPQQQQNQNQQKREPKNDFQPKPAKIGPPKRYGILIFDTFALAKAALEEIKQKSAAVDQLNILIKAEGNMDDPDLTKFGKVFAGAAWTVIHERRVADGWYDAPH